MIAKKKILIPVIFLFTVFSYGQTSKVEVIFKDGSKVEGFGRFTNTENVKFRKFRRAKEEFFYFKDIDTLKIYYDFEPNVYVQMPVEGKKKPKVLEVARTGKNVIFYRENISGFNGASGLRNGFSNFGAGIGSFYTIRNSYLRKPDAQKVIHLGSNSNHLFTKNFKKAAVEFFSDCGILVSKIQNKEFTKRDLKEVIDFYNNECD